MAEYDQVMRAFTVLVLFDTAISTGALADARQEKVKDFTAQIEEQVSRMEHQRTELLTVSEQLAATSEEALAATQEMASAARLIAEDARTADSVVGDMASNPSAGQTDMEALVDRITRASNGMAVVRGEVEDLTNNAREIESIVGLIRSIADQTNLLALNAAGPGGPVLEHHPCSLRFGDQHGGDREVGGVDRHDGSADLGGRVELSGQPFRPFRVRQRRCQDAHWCGHDRRPVVNGSPTSRGRNRSPSASETSPGAIP
jgi:hypothetical protein